MDQTERYLVEAYRLPLSMEDHEGIARMLHDREVFAPTFIPQADSPPCDFPTTVDLEEHQIFASLPWGSAVLKPIVSPDSLAKSSNTSHGMTMQLVGIFTGAFPQDNPQAGHFHYIDTAAQTIRSGQIALTTKGWDFEMTDCFYRLDQSTSSIKTIALHVAHSQGKLLKALGPDNPLPTELGPRSIRLPKQMASSVKVFRL